MSQTDEHKMTFVEQLGSLKPNFWYANVIEMFERLAYFGVRAIAPLYLVAGAGENGLGLSHVERGTIFTFWALVQCLVPMVSGGYSDRYGYRKSLAVAFIINIGGYLCMAQSRDLADWAGGMGLPNPNFWVFMFAALCVGFGTAIFKPPISGTIARSVDERTSSLGFGLFYWMVNIGGLLAPMGAAILRKDTDWSNVFYAAAIVTALNFIPSFLFYKEPDKGNVDTAQGPVEVFSSAIMNILRDGRLLIFLLLYACFWLMFMQLWDLLPVFIDEWIDTSDVAGFFGAIKNDWVLDGRVKPEMVINIDSAAIVLFCIPITWMIHRLNKVVAMVVGMVISLVAFVAAGSTMVGTICCLCIFIFAIGEMVCSPTFSAYIGLIAPEDKKALYMGYSNIPFAIGWALGNAISGWLYERIANKVLFAREYLVDHLGLSSEFVESIPKENIMKVFSAARDASDPAVVEQEMAAAYNSVNWESVPAEQVAEKWTSIMEPILGNVDKFDKIGTEILWNIHQPYMVWVYLGIFGVIGTVGIVAFYFFTEKNQKSLDAV